jgi:hypothetical protein
VDINRACKPIRENIKISAKEGSGYYELQKRKAWFDEGCSKLSYQMKQAKLQWLQDPSEINGDNLKDKIDELAMNSKNKNIRDLYKGINYFKRGYQPRRTAGIVSSV